MTELVVVGQVGRDLVLLVPEVPDPMGATDVRARRELLGGKGANQAVGARQLGASVTLLGVVGDDREGAAVLQQAAEDGIDVGGVVRREGTATALLVDLVTEDGTRRLLEDVPPATLLRPDDVRPAAGVLRSARMVLLQLQQPGEAVLEAARLARENDVPVLVDGAAEDPGTRRDLLALATVVRADAKEAAMLVDRDLDDVGSVVDAAQELVRRGAGLVALAAGSEGNVVAWADGHVVVPLLDPDLGAPDAPDGGVGDGEAPGTGAGPGEPTGAGDSFVAGLSTALLRGADPATAAWQASAAAALTAARLGGRPALSLDALVALADRARPAGRS